MAKETNWFHKDMTLAKDAIHSHVFVITNGRNAVKGLTQIRIFVDLLYR